MQKKPTPAPIFNHRKRPRQAVFADPLNDATLPGPSGAAVVPQPPVPKFSDLMPPQGFCQSRNQAPPPPRQQKLQPRPRKLPNTILNAAHMNNTNQGGFRQTAPAPTNSTFRGSFQQRPLSSQNSKPSLGSTNRSRNANNYNPRPAAGGSFPTNKQQTYSASYSGGQSTASSSVPGPYGDMGQQRGPPNFGNTWQQTQQARVMSRNFSSTTGGPSFESHRNQPATTTFPGDDDFDNVSAGYQAKPATSITTVPASAGKKTQTDFEKSLHFLTCNIAGLRRWNKFKDNIQLLFEIYGFLDSAVTKQGHDRKEFLLRDERKDALQCVFYEIDRQIPKLTRGQWIRCVGTLDTKTDIFRAASIRPIHEAERGVYRPLLNKSDQIMHKLTKTLREL